MKRISRILTQTLLILGYFLTAHKFFNMKNLQTILNLVLLLILFSCSGNRSGHDEFKPLFNGKDLTGWETYIGIPKPDMDIPGLPKDSAGEYTGPIGLNKDPLSVFTIVDTDGQPAIRISGQINGSLATREEFSNYHLRLQYKWGEKKWGSDPNAGRNSGVLFHGTGEYGNGLGVWKNSHECQLMETMAGDSYRMGDTFCDIKAIKPNGSDRYTYDPEGPSIQVGEGKEAGKIVSKNSMEEKPIGEWNTVEIICFNDKAIQIMNGRATMVITNSHLADNGRDVPLTKGNIQLQSEGAEVYFRNIEIKNINVIPAAYSNLF
jgi:hypothetical protein